MVSSIPSILQFPQGTTIFINDSFCPYYRSICDKCKKFRENKLQHSCFIITGVIPINIAKNSNIIEVCLWLLFLVHLCLQQFWCSFHYFVFVILKLFMLFRVNVKWTYNLVMSCCWVEFDDPLVLNLHKYPQCL